MIQFYSGIIRDLIKFDVGFFGVFFKLVDVMDLQFRMLMEVICEIFMDVGKKNCNFYFDIQFIWIKEDN